MFDWLLRLFDTTGFPPRWRCGDWPPALGWTHIAADVAIWAAYVGIPAVILLFLRRRRDLALQPVCWLFALFVAFCGFSHLVDAAMFWWPAYRLSAAVKVGTALVSGATLIALFPLTRRALLVPGTGELLARLREQASAHHRSQTELRLSQEQLRAAAMASGVGCGRGNAMATG